MEIVLTGVNHKTAPVAIRERVAIMEPHVPLALQALRASGFVRECVVLSTCNRTEIYCVGPRGGHAAEAAVQFLVASHHLDREELLPHVYHRFNVDVARHLFTVSSGLDSMILGEGQILSQVRGAFQAASAAKAVSKVLTRLFETAIHAGKRARTETRIAQGASSVSFAAVELARRIHGNLHGRPVLVLGTGKMGMLTARLLVTAGVGSLTLLSRTHQRAEEALRTFEGQVQTRAADMDHLEEELVRADIVISCTGAPVPVITEKLVARTLRPRRYRSLFIVDIAVPRDVEAGVNDLDSVFLYNVDDLCDVVDERMGDRHREVEKVQGILEEEVDEFTRYFASLEAVPAIRHLRESFEHKRAREVADLLARQELSPVERERLETFSRTLINRLLHGPTVRIKDMAAARNIHDSLHFLMEVFEPHGHEHAHSAPRAGTETTHRLQAPVEPTPNLPSNPDGGYGPEAATRLREEGRP